MAKGMGVAQVQQEFQSAITCHGHAPAVPRRVVERNGIGCDTSRRFDPGGAQHGQNRK
jgi:hypothetical protein